MEQQLVFMQCDRWQENVLMLCVAMQVKRSDLKFDAAVIVKTLGEAFEMLNKTSIPLVWVRRRTPNPSLPITSVLPVPAQSAWTVDCGLWTAD